MLLLLTQPNIFYKADHKLESAWDKQCDNMTLSSLVQVCSELHEIETKKFVVAVAGESDEASMQSLKAPKPKEKTLPQPIKNCDDVKCSFIANHTPLQCCICKGESSFSSPSKATLSSFSIQQQPLHEEHKCKCRRRKK